MHIKIYFGEKPLFLCDVVDRTIEPFVHHDDAVFIDELDTHTVKSMIHEMQRSTIHAGVFLHKDLATLKKAFWKKFVVVIAGGGLITNEKDEILMIFRRGKWDLPKGKLDKGETLEQCALREVQEETGLRKVLLELPLLTTYHTYHEGARFILKESHWFTMMATNGESLTPQIEEDIQEIKWVAKKEIRKYIAATFPSIVDVLKAGVLKPQQ